ncbi:MAG: 1-(5-phosphoribosyl)-5-[(5-phosphoribosylamino)methylideneamino]imidazole-4-carboxamide isomerase [Alphaproteobacteria bacterium]|nr:1-(5-phosphoribosyl)-5-[(5-phosphoribosylamino)methylideneamino]imidazole-4-carboxamide isomerase [Alphaproteobacteria bacterium]MCA0451270.1 1-(5-phosphoribosyl)-5-[(5-phosphoribosylamino)methylideneamino]imidazole-4-carboxamide isomerase [Pseudomonadota bacterium]
MILFPAIDLKGGKCVRLYKGDMAQATVFNDNPGDQAAQFVKAGARWIHVVDLDGAFAGKSVNADAVRAILKNANVPVQLGGGIRDDAAIASWLDAGVTRVILGTIALKDPDFVKRACKTFPAKIVVGIDARGGHVAVQGWAETSDMKAVDLARKFEDSGVAAIVYTDIDRDGALQGPNVDATVAMAKAVSIPVIASGGVASLDDLAVLKRHAKDGIAGVISGRALYDGRIDLRAAIDLLEAS